MGVKFDLILRKKFWRKMCWGNYLDTRKSK